MFANNGKGRSNCSFRWRCAKEEYGHSTKLATRRHVRAYLDGLLSDAKAAFAELPRWERGVHLFWLAGPFILLIERSPEDFWLSLIALIFAVRALILREGWWLRIFWVRAAFLFWVTCLASAASSSLPAYSIGETVAWFRFPLFAMATAFWLGRDTRLLYLMILSTGVGMVLMCGILTAEVIIVGHRAAVFMALWRLSTELFGQSWSAGLCRCGRVCNLIKGAAV